jgi:hypothetical protein
MVAQAEVEPEPDKGRRRVGHVRKVGQ